MNEALYFEQLKVGNRWKTRARTITETDVINFAGLTGDYDPLHVDREFAKQTPFGRPIAHGLLGLSFVAGLGSHFPAVHTVAFVAIQNWQFLLPAFIGDTVHAVIEITDLKDSSRRRGTVLWRRQLVNHKGDVVQQGIFETLVAKMPPGAVRKEATPERAKPKGRKNTKTSKPKKQSPSKQTSRAGSRKNRRELQTAKPLALAEHTTESPVASTIHIAEAG